MTSQLASGDLIADRYALALYDLSLDAKVVDTVLDDILLLQKIIHGSKDLNFVLKSPLILSSDKLNILFKIMDASSINELTKNFLKVISINKRFANILNVISQFININAQKRGDILADITSAEKLSDKQQSNIKEQLRTILGEKLLLNFKIDKKIIGGLIVKVGSKMIDTSLANKINKLKIAMKGA